MVLDVKGGEGKTRGEFAIGASATLIAAAVIAVLFAPALLGAGQFMYRDTGRMHAPMKKFLAEEMARGRFPEWNPYSGLGEPLVAGAVNSVQHPFNLLLLVLPFDAGFKAWTLLAYLVAACGGYVWGRALGRSFAAALLAGLGFAVSGALVSVSDNLTYLAAYAAIPWVLAAAQAFAERGGPARLAGVAAASAFCAAAGDPQSWACAVLVGAALPVLGGERGARSAAARRAFAAAGAALVGAVPFLLPVALWVPFSTRTAALTGAELSAWNLHPLRLLEVVVPGLFRSDPADPLVGPFQAYCGSSLTAIPWFLSVYVGATVIVLAVAAVRRSAGAAWVAAAAALFAWASLGPSGGLDRVLGWLPLTSRFRYSEKLFVWPALLLPMAAAFGVDAVSRDARRARAVAWAAGGGALVALVVAAACALGSEALAEAVARPGPGLGPARALVSNAQAAMTHVALVLALLALGAVAVARGRAGARGAGLLAAIAVLDAAAAGPSAYVLGTSDRGAPPLAAALASEGASARTVTPFTMREDRWPELSRVESTWRWGYRTLMASWNVPMHLDNSLVYAGLHEARYARLVAALDMAKLVPALGTWGFGYVVVPGDPGNAARAGVPPPAHVVATDPELPAYLVEMPHRPRAYLESRVAVTDADGAFRFATSAPREGSVVEVPLPMALASPPGTARITVDVPGHTEVETRGDGPALLVLNDALVPGWTARLDGRPVPILATNWVARGVLVPGGVHQVEFRYRTPGLLAGWMLGAAGAVGLCAWGLLRRRRSATASPVASVG